MLRHDGLSLWSPEAPRIMMQAHDRPSFAMESPCASWSFCVRPRREADPLTAVGAAAERERRRAWRKDIGAFLQTFIADPPGDGRAADGPVRAPEHPKPALDFAEDGEANFSPRSRNAAFYWRGMPGVLQMNYYSEFAQFVVTLSPGLTPPRFVADAARPAFSAEQLATRRKLEQAFATLAAARFANDVYHLPRRGDAEDEVVDRPAFQAVVGAAATVAYEEIWGELIGDLRGRRRVEPGGDVDGPLFRTAETFAEFALVAVGPVTPSAQEELDAAGADGDDQKAVERGLAPERIARFLERRARALDAIFDNGPDREFIAHGAERSRHIYVTTLSSTLRTRLERHDAPEALGPLSGAACAPRGLIYFVGAPQGRHFAGLQPSTGAPNAHQLGRLLERLHSIEMFRAAALLDFAAVDNAANALRRIGSTLDAMPMDAERQREREARALREALRDLKRLDGEPSTSTRGGVAYRVSRSKLYARSMERRLAELKIQPIPSWQPLGEYLNRRLRDRLDQIAEIGDRRDRLLRRLTLLIDDLQWDELNEIQRDNARTQQAVAAQTAVNTAIGALAFGVTAGSLITHFVEPFKASVLAMASPPLSGYVVSLVSPKGGSTYDQAGVSAFVALVVATYFALRWAHLTGRDLAATAPTRGLGLTRAVGLALKYGAPLVGAALIVSALTPATWLTVAEPVR